MHHSCEKQGETRFCRVNFLWVAPLNLCGVSLRKEFELILLNKGNSLLFKEAIRELKGNGTKLGVSSNPETSPAWVSLGDELTGRVPGAGDGGSSQADLGFPKRVRSP